MTERAARAVPLLSIQYLRALAAIAVVIYHVESRAILLGYDGPWPHWLAGGVDLFFVISGFIMVATTDGRADRPGRFWRRRARRIVPIYWIATAVAFALVGWTGWHTLASFLFTGAVSPVSGEVWPLLVPGWTLNYEMFFYALFGLALLVPERFRVQGMIAALGTLVLIGLSVRLDPIGAFYTAPLLLEFSLGMILARVVERLRPSVWALPIGVAAMAIFGAPDEWRLVTLGLPALLIAAGAVSMERSVRHSAVAKALGNASYSIYLFHGFALTAVFVVARVVGLPWWIYAPVAVAAAVVAGYVAWWLVERPLGGYWAKRSAGASRAPVSACEGHRT